MNDYRYTVTDGATEIAKGMQLDDALTLIKALAEKYYADPTFEMVILREEADYED